MRKTFYLFVAALISVHAYGQTSVSGTVSGTWTKANSPYLVVGDISVVVGTSLTIEPGVQVKFDGRYQFKVNGLLTAVGTATDTILFTHQINHADSLWRGIRFSSADPKCVLDYCKVEYSMATTGMRGGGISCDKTHLTIKNSRIENNKSNNVSAYAGGFFSLNSNVVITNTTFAYNRALVSEGGGACFLGGTANLINCYFKNNHSGNQGGAINNTSNLMVIGSRFLNNTGSAEDLRNDGGKVKLINCTLYHTTITYSALENGSGQYYILNSILYNTGGISFNDDWVVLYSDPYSTSSVPVPGEGNLHAPPQFVDPEAGDFRLQAGSPCIDAGHPWSLYDDVDGTRNDMGCTGGTGLAAIPLALEFGSVGGGQTRTLPWELLNGRLGSFTISSGVLANTLDFSADFIAPMVLPPIKRDTIQFTFQPQSSGLMSTEFTMNSSELSAPVVLNLSGYGGVWCGSVSGTWSKTYSPYIIGCDILVPSGETLTIEAGVQVLVDASLSGSIIKFTVQGTLAAVGTETDSITFSLLDNEEVAVGWQGLIIADGGTAKNLTKWAGTCWLASSGLGW